MRIRGHPGRWPRTRINHLGGMTEKGECYGCKEKAKGWEAGEECQVSTDRRESQRSYLALVVLSRFLSCGHFVRASRRFRA